MSFLQPCQPIQLQAVPSATAGNPVHYERRRREETILYQLIQEHVETFFAQVEAETGSGLPDFVKDEFDAFLECGVLAHGFLRLRCEDCTHEKLVAFSCKCRGFCPSCGARRMAQTAAHLVEHVIPQVSVRQWVLRFQSRAVTLIQRFGSAVNLNIHLHCLFLDGVYRIDDGVPIFQSAPATEQLQTLLTKIIKRIMKLLTRRGYLIEEQGITYMAETDSDPALAPLQSAACTYRIAFGPRAGQKVLSLKTVPTEPKVTERQRQLVALAYFRGYTHRGTLHIFGYADRNSENNPASGHDQIKGNDVNLCVR